MKLYEFEAKGLLNKSGIKIPNGQLIDSPTTKIKLKGNFLGKAQVLYGSRAKKGLISKDIKAIFNNQGVRKVLVEEFIQSDELYYLSITFYTEIRGPVILFSKQGGVEVETAKSVNQYPLDLTKGDLPKIEPEIDDIVSKMWQLFKDIDARLIEINPLAETKTGFVALDAKIILDDDALFRHPELTFSPRNPVGKSPTKTEQQASEIDKSDHRGSAGSSYIELDGDIAIIAAGGGGSVVNMDTLIALGGKPANYTEHSGNPPAEKVEKLTKIVLSKPGLNGLWFVGATANFTDMVETLTGFITALRAIKPKPRFPIVIRRGGPRWEEAKKMLKEARDSEGFDLHIYGPETPMTSTAKIIVDLVNDYKRKTNDKSDNF